ncbi:ORF30 [Fowl aviadenovirus 10]|uniref:ORF30 n=1 Tax=Fowl adenovirus C serotype 10 (strain SA2) TaxID=10547 RepID=A0A7G3VXB2_ADEGX|nr:ORF30 [Fowl aviadenovirus 10]
MDFEPHVSDGEELTLISTRTLARRRSFGLRKFSTLSIINWATDFGTDVRKEEVLKLNFNSNFVRRRSSGLRKIFHRYNHYPTESHDTKEETVIKFNY